ncbi:DUF4153 domain-containing protein [Massilia sp. TW-1]|uniref:DUF4153 domain-containing protein n=1 Tax=Telluria antibiotica TaxID=2717319 RepID=A0ABX0P8C4_9BURK|nr:DUF4153 domain-containing protein [Telluria antibiotica]NIA53476.1 DUF4153 domain-containing protein [Telluria antibiotica]
MQPSDAARLSAEPPLLTLPRVGGWRILLGLLQGLLLYLLYHATTTSSWPATQPLVFGPLVLVAFFVPLILISGLGHLDRRRLVLWGCCAALLLAALAGYDAWRVADLPLQASQAAHRYGTRGVDRSPFPSWRLGFFAAAGFFIAHTLVLAAVRDGRRIAAYPTYFDTAWKLGVQLAFSGLFTGITWLVLALGAELFELVKLDFLTRLMRESWFAIPVTAFAFACAMHLTDVRPAIVRGIRGLLLVLLSWLLPVTVLLIGGFLAALPFTGLAPLWNTKHAASVLLCAAAACVVLVNAAWQQGEDERAVARVVRVAARIAALLLAPLVLIAMYALFLRVRDYGWSADRIDAAACMLVAACYAAGYFCAGLRPGWLTLLARVNIGVAFVLLGVLLALFSPLLDPARISVDSQVARLASGKVKPDAFDFAFLRFDGARFGRAALDRLERMPVPDADVVRRIAAVRRMESRWDRKEVAPRPLELAANLHVHPDGARLPDTFLRTDWAAREPAYQYPACLRDVGRVCDVFLLDVTGDGKPEVLLFERPAASQSSLVLQEDAQGGWSALATVSLPGVDCPAADAALAAGKVDVTTPELADVLVGGVRGRLERVTPPVKCPAAPR